MSGLCGIYNLDGSPVDRGMLASMMDSMAGWGPDGKETYFHKNVGLGHLMLYNTPESLKDKLPLICNESGLTIIASVRLDNRDDLYELFSVPYSERPRISDVDFILMLYRRLGRECVHNLIGDWSFTIYDKHKNELFIARDQTGYGCIYYHKTEKQLIFASSIKSIVNLSHISKSINQNRIAKLLICMPSHSNETSFQNIFKMQPAHFMSANQQKFQIQKYWDLKNKKIRYKKANDYVDAFLEIYQKAVSSRLRSSGDIGIFLSGGLDSSSVAAIAAKELIKQEKTLYSYTSVPIYKKKAEDITSENRFSDESEYVQDICRHVGNIKPEFIDAKEISPLEGIERCFEMFLEPVHAATNMHWIFSILNRKDSHISTMLTGQRGNTTMSWSGNCSSYELLKSFKLKELVKDLKNHKREKYKSSSQMIRRELINPMSPYLIKYYYGRLKKGSFPWKEYSVINDEFTKRIVLLRQIYKSKHNLLFGGRGDSFSQRHAWISRASTFEYHTAGAAFNIEFRDPTIDKRLIEYCLSIPEDQYYSCGSNRYLMRRAFQTSLCPSVVNNQKIGRQSSDIGFRVLNHFKEIEVAFNSIKQSMLVKEILDVNMMERVFHSVKLGVTRENNNSMSSLFLRPLMVGMFLKKYE